MKHAVVIAVIAEDDEALRALDHLTDNIGQHLSARIELMAWSHDKARGRETMNGAVRRVMDNATLLEYIGEHA